MNSEAQTNEIQTTPKKSILKNKWVQSAGWVVLLLLIVGVILYFQMSGSQVSIDTSLVSAPTISLSSSAGGDLQAVYVNEGDVVPANTVVATVGTTPVKTQVAGIITSVQQNIGAAYNPGQPVVTMVDPSQLKVVGTIDENKGLSRIKVGQLAEFTVDAFGSKKYEGVVDEISPTANQQDVVFNISDARQVMQFNIKVRFDASKYPELKNGMSAKLTIFTK